MQEFKDTVSSLIGTRNGTLTELNGVEWIHLMSVGNCAVIVTPKSATSDGDGDEVGDQMDWGI